jgi:hypothetical protein
MSEVITKSKAKKKHSTKFENLVGPTDPKVDALARERLVTARIGLLLRQSFFGNLATRLQLVNADEWCSTAATDGLKFYYNSRFIMMLKPKEVEFLVGHEESPPQAQSPHHLVVQQHLQSPNPCQQLLHHPPFRIEKP